MSNNLVLFDPSTPAAVPDYIKNRTDLRHDVIAHESVPSITFRGSKWRLKKGDEETLLTKMVDGEKIPIPSISLPMRLYRPFSPRIWCATGLKITRVRFCPPTWSMADSTT